MLNRIIAWLHGWTYVQPYSIGGQQMAHFRDSYGNHIYVKRGRLSYTVRAIEPYQPEKGKDHGP